MFGLTPSEFYAKLEAFNLAQEKQMEQQAWFTAYLMNCWTARGKTIQPRHLLPKKPRKKGEGEEVRKHLKEVFKLN